MNLSQHPTLPKKVIFKDKETLKNKVEASGVAHTLNSNTQETEAGKSPYGLKDIQGYVLKPYF